MLQAEPVFKDIASRTVATRNACCNTTEAQLVQVSCCIWLLVAGELVFTCRNMPVQTWQVLMTQSDLESAYMQSDKQ